MRVRQNMLKELEGKIGYTFHDIRNLQTALRHTSFVKGDGKGREHNQRMEFLGDAVLELCVSEYIYRTYQDCDEGAMTRLRAAVVCEPALYQAAQMFDLQDYIQLGRGEETTGGRQKPSIVSDAFEALIGAIFLDGGFEAAKVFIESFSDDMVRQAAARTETKDYKTMLQEYVQKRHWGSVRYELVEEKGPDHKKTFMIRVCLGEEQLGEGAGNSKQDAGQQAAKQALLRYGALS